MRTRRTIGLNASDALLGWRIVNGRRVMRTIALRLRDHGAYKGAGYRKPSGLNAGWSSPNQNAGKMIYFKLKDRGHVMLRKIVVGNGAM